MIHCDNMKLEKLIKNYQQVQKEYRQLSLEIETIQQDYEKVKNKYLEIKTKISSLNQQIIQEQEIYDEYGNVCMVVDADLKNRVQTALLDMLMNFEIVVM